MTDKSKEDIFVYLLNLPDGTKEAVSSNEDGTFSIFINSKLSRDGQLRAYEHALRHIQRNDFHKEDVQAIEYNVRNHDNEVKAIPAHRYVSEIRRLQREQRRIKAKIKADQERIQFLQQYCDMFALTEHHKLYGDDL